MAVEEFGFVEDLNGLVHVAVFAVGFDDGGDCGGGERETVVVVVVVLHLVDDVPHGLVVV